MSARGIAMPASAPRFVGEELLAGPTRDNHIVQFYEDASFLSEVVASFLGGGLVRGEPAVVVATEQHRMAFGARLSEMGFDLAACAASGRLVMLDARIMLARFMVGRTPDWGRFCDAVGGMLASTRRAADGGPRQLRAYGEMVDLLWRDGNPEGALQLEAMWNDLATDHSFSLLCGYAMRNFPGEADGHAFARVCRTHSHVLPADDFSQLGQESDRLREVVHLQQQARALRVEIERRKETERSLVAALRVRDDFLSIAGHELRTPLTALDLQMQTLEVLAEGLGNAALRERVAKVARYTQRMGTLIEQLLDVSRLDTGGVALQLEPLDLAAILREVVDRTSGLAQQAGCQVHVVAENVVGQWDRMRLDQVLTNVLGNAFKFGHGRPIDVSLTAREGGVARVTVRDQGPGIPAADQARIFHRFERAVSPQNYGGLGLGLWITSQILQAHGGSIRVDSQLGQGATFVIDLPTSLPAG